jgi:dienelactone hydrolase
MTIITKTVNYVDGEALLEAFVAYDDAITDYRPAVLIQHTWCGRDEFVMEKAKKIAKLGYVGIAVDNYGNGILGTSPEQNAKLMQPFMEDRLLLKKRLMAAFRAAKLMPWVDGHSLAAIGFCFGGLCALDLARTGYDIKGVVSFHGILHAPKAIQGNPIKAKVLVLHGNEDPLAPIEDVIAFQKEMTAAGADWQLHTYSHTAHAFTNPNANDPASGMYYQPNSDDRSWLAMKNFLAEVFAET